MDSNHSKAFAIAKSLDLSGEVITTWEVVDEVITKLAYYQSRKIALQFIVYLLNSKTRIEYITIGNQEKIFQLFQKQASKKVSLTDCANMVIAKEFGVATICSFDHHYEQNGFKLQT